MREHEVAVAILVDGDRVLLAHRCAERRWYPNCWDLIGGHLEPGESPWDALQRECGEEIGVHVDTAAPLQMPYSDPGIELHAFVVTGWTGEIRNLAPEEHDDLRWFQAAELKGLTLAAPACLPVLTSVLDRPRGLWHGALG